MSPTDATCHQNTSSSGTDSLTDSFNIVSNFEPNTGLSNDGVNLRTQDGSHTDNIAGMDTHGSPQSLTTFVNVESLESMPSMGPGVACLQMDVFTLHPEAKRHPFITITNIPDHAWS